MSTPHEGVPKEEAGLGAVEDDAAAKRGGASQTSMSGQLGHRDEVALLKESDSGLPGPDAHEEHTGEPGA